MRNLQPVVDLESPSNLIAKENMHRTLISTKQYEFYRCLDGGGVVQLVVDGGCGGCDGCSGCGGCSSFSFFGGCHGDCGGGCGSGCGGCSSFSDCGGCGGNIRTVDLKVVIVIVLWRWWCFQWGCYTSAPENFYFGS